MSCPKCNGFVCFESDIISVEHDCDGVWIYHRAYCEDCDWKGYGKQFHKCITEMYVDGVELPTETGLVIKEEL